MVPTTTTHKHNPYKIKRTPSLFLQGFGSPHNTQRANELNFSALQRSSLVTDPTFGAYGSFRLWSLSIWDWELWRKSLLAWSSSPYPGEETERLIHAGGSPCKHAQKGDWAGGHSLHSIWKSSSPAGATNTTCPVHHRTHQRMSDGASWRQKLAGQPRTEGAQEKLGLAQPNCGTAKHRKDKTYSLN